jgi:hypothetical protein
MRADRVVGRTSSTRAIQRFSDSAIQRFGDSRRGGVLGRNERGLQVLARGDRAREQRGCQARVTRCGASCAVL